MSHKICLHNLQLESYMTENFVIAAFRKMGEEPQTVRLMRNKYTGEPAGYCFVNFQSDDQAIDAMHKLNGKPIPGTNPIVRFRLNSASNSNKLPGNEREFSVWVGDLSSDVDDYSLYRAFSAKYTSIKTAKVILDTSGFSKGYGFVRFGLEEEQKAALYEMNGWLGLGSKSLKICNAVPKPKTGATAGTTNSSSTSSSMQSSGYGASSTSSTTDYSQYYDPSAYWQGYSSGTAWQGYEQPAAAAQPTDYTAYYQQQAIAHAQQHQQQQQQLEQTAAAESWQSSYHYDRGQEDDDLALVGMANWFNLVFKSTDFLF